VRPAPAASAVFFASLAIAGLVVAVLFMTRPAAMPWEHPKLTNDQELELAKKFHEAPLRDWLVGSHSDLSEDVYDCRVKGQRCDLYARVQFYVVQWREMVWYLVAGLGVGLIGLAGATRRVQEKRSMILVLLACAAWVSVGVPKAIVFTGWMLIAYIAIMKIHARNPLG
jgi:hypothetical protein